MIKASDTIYALDVYSQRPQNSQADKRPYNPPLLSVIEMREIKTGGINNIQEGTNGTGFFGS